MSQKRWYARHILRPKPVSQYYNFRDYYYLIFTKQISYATFDFRHNFRLFFPVRAVENLYLRTGVFRLCQ